MNFVLPILMFAIAVVFFRWSFRRKVQELDTEVRDVLRRADAEDPVRALRGLGGASAAAHTRPGAPEEEGQPPLLDGPGLGARCVVCRGGLLHGLREGGYHQRSVRVLAHHPGAPSGMAPRRLGGQDHLQAQRKGGLRHRPLHEDGPRRLRPGRHVQVLRPDRQQRGVPHPVRPPGVPGQGDRHPHRSHRLRMGAQPERRPRDDPRGGVHRLERPPGAGPQGEPRAEGQAPGHRPRLRQGVPRQAARRSGEGDGHHEAGLRPGPGHGRPLPGGGSP